MTRKGWNVNLNPGDLTLNPQTQQGRTMLLETFSRLSLAWQACKLWTALISSTTALAILHSFYSSNTHRICFSFNCYPEAHSRSSVIVWGRHEYIWRESELNTIHGENTCWSNQWYKLQAVTKPITGTKVFSILVKSANMKIICQLWIFFICPSKKGPQRSPMLRLNQDEHVVRNIKICF